MVLWRTGGLQNCGTGKTGVRPERVLKFVNLGSGYEGS